MVLWKDKKHHTSSCVGLLFRERAHLVFISRTDNFWKSWLVALLSSCPMCCLRADPSFLTSPTATSTHPPRVYTARGRKASPCLMQASATSATFLSKATCRALPGVPAA